MRRDCLRLMLPSHKISISNSVFASRKLTSTENELSDENKVFTNQEKRLKMVEEIENLGMSEAQTSAAKQPGAKTKTSRQGQNKTSSQGQIKTSGQKEKGR